jgi:hypothetical protein
VATEFAEDDPTHGMKLPADVMARVKALSLELEAMADDIQREMGDMVDDRGVLDWHGRIAARMVGTFDAAVSALDVVRQEPGGDLFDPAEYFRPPRLIPVELEEAYGLSRLMDEADVGPGRPPCAPGPSGGVECAFHETQEAHDAFWGTVKPAEDD